MIIITFIILIGCIAACYYHLGILLVWGIKDKGNSELLAWFWVILAIIVGYIHFN